jgi:PAS domain S-box-containing protein
LQTSGAFPFVFFYPSIAAAAYIGGYGPGLAVMAAAGLFGALVPPQFPGALSWFALFFFGIGLTAAACWVRGMRERAIAMAEESARLRFVIEYVSDWIFLIDEFGKVEYMNQTACSQLGVEAGRMTGQPMDDLVAEPARGLIRELVARVRQEPVAPQEILLRRGDGSTILAEVSCTGWRTISTTCLHPSWATRRWRAK